jgi:hypothetical protein
MASREIEKKRKEEKILIKRKKLNLSPSPTILIVCEGKNTETSYFSQIQVRGVTIDSIGVGYNTVSLVRKAEELAALHAYDEVWCVFDKDDFSPHDFNNAIHMAEKKHMHAVYSNQAFEFWLILHFNDHQGGALHRSRYNKMLNEELQPYGVLYDGEGCKVITQELFNLMVAKDPKTGKKRNELAIERAERIYERLDHCSPAVEESSTTVYMLMKHLMGFSRY